MATRIKAQVGLEDRIVDNPELLEMLENRQELKAATKEYRQADKKAKDKIASIQTEMPYRVGRFIISKQAISARSVSFETNPGSRIAIKTVDED